MNKIERVQSALSGHFADRAPVSFWHHFDPPYARGQRTVEMHLGHLEKYDVDFLKVMNDHGYPWHVDGIVDSLGSLMRLKQYDGGAGPFGEQLEVLAALSSSLKGQVLMTTTIFGPWAVLRLLTAPPADKHGPPKMTPPRDARDRALERLLKEDRKAMGQALLVIAQSLAGFARECLRAGADGIFLSVRDDWVDSAANGQATYDELVRPADLMVLEAVKEAPFNMLHVCGRPLNFRRFASYPVQAINWADRSPGPAIKETAGWLKAAICAGLDNLNTLVNGTPEQCVKEAQDAIQQAAPRPLIIAPGCTYDPEKVPQANLKAVVEALRGGG